MSKSVKRHRSGITRLCAAPSRDGTRRFAGSKLRPRDPPTPAEVGLPLLPSGPHGVHRHAPQRAQPSTPHTRGLTLAPPPSGSHSAPRKRVVENRGPLAPHLAQALAEGAGFEPAVPRRVHQFSKLADSAALPPLRCDSRRRDAGIQPRLPESDGKRARGAPDRKPESRSYPLKPLPALPRMGPIITQVPPGRGAGGS